MFGYILKNSNRVQPKRYCTDWNEQNKNNPTVLYNRYIFVLVLNF